MYHSITFGTKNTWDDWHLIPTSRPSMPPPNPNLMMVDVPGRDGSIDLTDVVLGRATYANRSGSLQFYIDNDHTDWVSLYSEIMGYLHGKRMHMILEDDPSYYYDGRFSVSAFSSGKSNSTITINYNVDPYKHHVNSSGQEWLWDPFNFELDMIREYMELTISNGDTLVIDGDPEPSTPTITVTNASNLSMDHTYDGHTLTFALSNGTNLHPRFVIREGTNTLIFHGSGKVTIDYRGGRL